MDKSAFDLKALLWPLDVEAFFQETWERRPLKVSRQQPGYYQRLLSLADIDDLIYYGRPEHFLDPPKNLRLGVGRTNGHALPLGEIWRAYAQGKTVAVHGVEQRWAPVTRCCRGLELALSHRVNANLYMTPEDSQGFDAHYDHQDVFIVQVAGAKHWRLYGPVGDLPAEHGAHVTRERLGPPEEYLLEDGDLLYIPRGHVHEAYTTDQSSAHLTIGVFIQHWSDLLLQAVACLTDRDRRCREALPVAFLSSAGAAEQLRARFAELLQELARQAPLAEALERLRTKFVGQLAGVPSGQFAALAAGEGVGLGTLLKRKTDMIGALATSATAASLRFPGSRVDEPAAAAAALGFVADPARGTAAFTARELPGELTDAARLALAQRLVREGFLEVAPQA